MLTDITDLSNLIYLSEISEMNYLSEITYMSDLSDLPDKCADAFLPRRSSSRVTESSA